MCLYIIYEDFFDTFGTELVSDTLATQFSVQPCMKIRPRCTSLNYHNKSLARYRLLFRIQPIQLMQIQYYRFFLLWPRIFGCQTLSYTSTTSDCSKNTTKMSLLSIHLSSTRKAESNKLVPISLYNTILVI